ncbi:hypothetical protein VPHK225_0006 [Vibrio phage K225]
MCYNGGTLEGSVHRPRKTQSIRVRNRVARS